jgi:hypothetical protein
MDWNKEQGKHIPPPYPFEINEGIISTYSSIKKAERAMQEYITEDNRHHTESSKIHSFLLVEYEMDKKYDSKDSYFHQKRPLFSYLANGQFADSAFIKICTDLFCEYNQKYGCSDRLKRNVYSFCGKETGQIRFKVGDLVEVKEEIDGKEVMEPALILGTPYSKEMQSREFVDDMYEVMKCTDSDQKILTVDDIMNGGCGCDKRSFPTNIFLPTFPVPEETKQHLQELYQAYFSEERKKNMEKLCEICPIVEICPTRDKFMQ